MSEPVTTATATESGGPDIQPPSIGGAAKPFEGMDGKRYEPSPPPAAEPRPRRRRAAPAESLTPADGPPAGGAPLPAPAVATPTVSPQQEERPGMEALRHPGESDAEFYPRIRQEDRIRIQKLTEQQRETEGRAERALREAVAHIQQQGSEIDRLRALVEPVFNRQAQEEENRRREEVMSQIPDPEAGPEERERYNTMVLQALLQRQQALEAQLQNNRTQDQQQAVERQQQEAVEAYIADRDEGIKAEMDQLLAADPAARQQVQAHLDLSRYQLRQFDPQASEEEIEEAVYMIHLSELVDAKAQGRSLADYYRQQAYLIQQTAQTFGMQPAPRQVQQQPAVPQNGSPTAAQVAREATRAGTATGGPGRPGGAPGGENLPTHVYKTEDEYLRAGLRKEFDEDWIRLSLGRPAGEGGGRRRR